MRTIKVSKTRPEAWDAVPEEVQTWDDAWGKHTWDPKKNTITCEYAEPKPMKALIKRKYRGW